MNTHNTEITERSQAYLDSNLGADEHAAFIKWAREAHDYPEYARLILDSEWCQGAVAGWQGAVEAARQRGGEPVEEGWKLIAVNEVWDSLVRALDRAASKGYMPEAMGEEWDAFDWTEAPQSAEPVDKSANLQGNQVDKPAKTQGQTDEPQSGARVQDGDDQDWANTDPAIAFHLIDRYAKDWNDVGRMMQAYADAHIEADRQHTADLLKNPVHVHTNMCRGIIAPITFDQLAHVLGDEATLEWLASRQQRGGEPVGELRPDDQSDDEVWAEIWADLPPGTKLYAEPVQKAQKECSKDAERSESEGWRLVPKELIDFLDAKEHHLPVEDRHVLSIMLAAAPKFGEDT